MDEFDQAQTCSEGDDGSEVLVGLFASERDPLEALEPADTLLDARAGLVEGLKKAGLSFSFALCGRTGAMPRALAASRLALLA